MRTTNENIQQETESPNFGIIGVGLPGTGKSTFVAAFRHAVMKKESGCQLTLVRMSQNTEYLNIIEEDWCGFVPLVRTNQTGEQIVNFEIKDELGLQAEIVLPDLAGESFEEIFLQRKIREDLVDLIRKSSGILLFLHPENISPPAYILDSLRALKNMGFDNVSKADSDDSLPFDPAKCPTQVILVDLLQIILEFTKSKCKLSIIVSAWDTVLQRSEDGNLLNRNPESWLAYELPLLFQFIQSNFAIESVGYFGVSAQGGDYEDKTQLSDLQRKEPHKRIIVQLENDITHDITLPLKFLLSNNGN